MTARFDDEGSSVELSVADLLERELSGSIGFANRGGYERMWLGQAIHSAYQERALAEDGSYRREVPLATEIVHKGWQARIRGRADGLRREADGSLVVEEIKSVRRGGHLGSATREAYSLQALVYAWMVAREEEAPVRAELVLIEIGSDAVDREPLDADLAEIEVEVRRRIGRLLLARERAAAAAARRREVAGELRFPFSELRPGQDEILEAVERTLENRDHLLVEAPTGIGKTVATLLPVLRRALSEEKRVFVLTAKTLQQDMAMKVLGLLEGGRGFDALRIRAKARMCANGEIICHEEYCSYARDYHSKVRSTGVVDRILDTDEPIEPETVYRLATDAEVCPFETSLDVAGRSQAVVCDYNYVFDPYVALSDFSGDGDLSDVILVVDEIHNLVERGRGYYSPSLSAERARGVARSFAARVDPLFDEIETLCHDLAGLVEGWVEDQVPAGTTEAAVESVLPEDELWALRPRFDSAFVDYLEYRRENKAFRAEDPFVALYFDLLKFLDVVRLLDEAFSTVAARGDGDHELRILCKDPSRFLGRIVRRTHSTIGMSATVSPVEFYRDLLGFDPERTASLSVPNPFPLENRCVVIDTAVETTYRKRPFYYDEIARRLSRFAAAVPGNCLALFPSYAFLATVADRLDADGKRVLVQERTDSNSARQEILDTLRGALFGDVLLLAVAGGVFAEGVDYPGEMLQAVAVVGPCLPAVTLERQLLKVYYQERFERGFEYAFVVPGMTRVVQAAGRLLRSPDDRGVIALLDRRFLANPYRRHLPGDWLPPEGPEGLVGDVDDAAARFFGDG